VEKKRAYYGHMNIGDAAEETAFVAGLESGALIGIIQFFGAGHDADTGDGFTKGVIPVASRRNVFGVVDNGGGTGHVEVQRKE